MADAAISADVDTTVDVDTVEAATTGAARPFPHAEDFAVTATAEADVPSAEADVASVAPDVPLVAVAVPLVVVDAASVAVAIPLAEAGTVEAVMVVGTGRFRH
jgi:hypothetical protein